MMLSYIFKEETHDLFTDKKVDEVLGARRDIHLFTKII